MPGRLMSNVYLARPLTLSGPSSRLTRVPTTAGFDDHWNRGSACGGGVPPRPPPCGACGWLATLHPLHARHRLEDAVEGAAAADVAVEPLLDLLGGRIRMFLEQADARHDEARRAEAAHERVLLAEGRLHRMQRAVSG